MGKKPPRKPKAPAVTRKLYQHTPQINEGYDLADAYTNVDPIPGVDFHNSGGLDAYMRQAGTAPDALFRQGLAAPPLNGNESGLRHYEIQLNADRNRVLNLDVPTHSQTPEVQAALARLGIRPDSPTWAGDQLTPTQALWQRQLDVDYPGNHFDNELLARRLASNEPTGNPEYDAQLSDLRQKFSPGMIDELNGVGIPAATKQGTGYYAGSAYSPLQTSPEAVGPVKEYKVFNPNLIRILRAAAVPGAIAAGSAANTASAAMAQPGEDLADYFQRMQPSRPSERTGEVLSKSDRVEYEPEYPRFRKEIAAAMNRPIIRTGEQPMSPAEWLHGKMVEEDLPLETISNVVRSVLGKSTDPYDTRAQALTKEMLDHIAAATPGAPNALNAGTTDSEYAKTYAEHGRLEARHQLTPAGQENFNVQRDYDLLRTFQDGTHAPAYTNGISKALAIGGTVFDKSGVTGKLAYDRTMGGDPGRLREAMYWYDRGFPSGSFANSFSGAKYPGMSSTTMEGIGNKAQNYENKIPAFGSLPFERALFNWDRIGENNQTNVMPFGPLASAQDRLLRTTPIYPDNADPEKMAKLTQDIRDHDRESRGFANAYYPLAVKQANSILKPLMASPEAWGGSVPTQEQAAEPQKGYPVTFLPTGLEQLSNLPRDMVDASAAASALFPLLGGLMKEGVAGAGAARRVGGMLNDLPGPVPPGHKAAKLGGLYDDLAGEVAQGHALDAAAQPSEDLKPSLLSGLYHSAFTPQKTSIVTDPAGNPTPADSPDYEKNLDGTLKRRESRWRSIMDDAHTLRGK